MLLWLLIDVLWPFAIALPLGGLLSTHRRKTGVVSIACLIVLAAYARLHDALATNASGAAVIAGVEVMIGVLVGWASAKAFLGRRATASSSAGSR